MYAPEGNGKRHRLYEIGVNIKKQQSRDELRVTENGKCSANTEIFNPEASNYLTKSLK